MDVASLAGLSGSNKWSQGVLALNGKIYGLPSFSTGVLIIDPSDNTTDVTTIAGLAGNAKWNGGVLAPSGKLYGIPYNSDAVLVAFEHPLREPFNFSGCSPPTCDGRPSFFPLPPNTAGGVGGTGAQAVGQAFGATLVFPCAAGHKSAAGINVTYTCDVMANFTSTDGCTAYTCDGTQGAVPTPPNADSTGVIGSAEQVSTANCHCAALCGL